MAWVFATVSQPDQKLFTALVVAAEQRVNDLSAQVGTSGKVREGSKKVSGKEVHTPRLESRFCVFLSVSGLIS